MAGPSKQRRRTDHTLKAARAAKRAGVSKADWVKAQDKGIHDAGREGGWRASEIAATYAHMAMCADKVWTVLTYKFKKVSGGTEYVAQAYGHEFHAEPSRFGYRVTRDGVPATIRESLEDLNVWLNDEPRAKTQRLS
jgi:hypothetical protein